jgi:hypothetical protein
MSMIVLLEASSSKGVISLACCLFASISSLYMLRDISADVRSVSRMYRASSALR